MIDFDFVAPTKVYFGKGKESLIGEIASAFSFKKVLLVYGSDRIKTNGLYDLICEKLRKSGIERVDFCGIRANPTIEKVREGIALARQEGIDSIIAVGGGSIIDTAKSIGVGFYYEGDPFDFNLKVAAPKKSLPLGVVLTISSAGSEMSNSCVIQNDALGIKQGFNNDIVRPVFAIENPELTYSVSAYQTAAGFSDIMMHSLERYHGDGDSLADEWALDLIADTMKNGVAALENPSDYAARAALMVNSSFSHNGMTGFGKKVIFVVHPLEHALSGYRSDITHGAGVALLYPAWAKYVYKKSIEKFARLAERLFKVQCTDDEQKAIMGIEAMKSFFASIGMPTTFKQVGLTEKDIPALVKIASGNGTRVIGGCPQSLDAEDIERIYRSLLTEEDSL